MAKEKQFRIKFTETGADNVRREMTRTERSSDKLAASLKNVAAGFAGFFSIQAVGNFVKSSIQIASQFESLQVRLQNLYGSLERGNEAFATFQKIAATTPFALKDVVEAGAQLKAFGVDAEANIKILADLAAFMSTDIVQAASAMGRAFAGGAGAADIFREKGILTLIETRTGFDRTKGTIEEFREAMFKAFADPRSGITGATDKLSNTFEGAMSNMGDALDQFKVKLVSAKLPELTQDIKTLTGALAYANQIEFNNNSLFPKFFDLLNKALPTQRYVQTLINLIKATAESMAEVASGSGRGDVISAVSDSVEEVKLTIEDFIPTAEEFANSFAPIVDDFGLMEIRAGNLLDQLERTGAIIDFVKAFAEAAEKIREAREELEEIGWVVPEIKHETSLFWDSMRDNANKFSDVLTRVWIEQWEKGGNFFQRLLDAWVQTLEAMVAEYMSRAAIFALLSLIPGVNIPAALGTFTNWVFGGGRQHGGPVQKGQAYVVGERGPEIFVPPDNGRIEKSTTTNLTIVTSDPVSFEQWLRENDGGRTIQRLIAEV